MNNPYKTEEEYLNQVENFLIKCGFKTWREVIPDEHKDYAMPFRIDLIFFKEELGYVALEGKNFRSLRQGGAFAKAIEQINKYRNLTFFNGIKINKWCISSPVNIPAITSKKIEERVILELSYFIQHFINYMFDISVLELKECINEKYSHISIDSNIKDRVIHINKNDIKGGGINGDSISKI